MVSTPKAPDPMETAQAQSGMNRDTATTQQLLNMTNQVTPTGTLNYNQTGTNSFVGADGKTVNLPQFTATTQLSPAQQAIFDKTQGAQSNLAGIAQDQSGFLKGYLNEPFSYDNDDAEAWSNDLARKRLDPMFEQQRAALDTKLSNQGIKLGSSAYDRATNDFGQTRNDAYNQLALTGRQQGFTEALAQRNQPINEITALMSGSQVSQPQFQPTPQTGVAGVNYTGLVEDKYARELEQSQAKMGGLFGLAAAPFGMFQFSDRRLKSDIRRVGALDNGLPVYAYRLGDGPTQIGVMADEVETAMPEAVTVHPSGFQMVDYDLATGAV